MVEIIAIGITANVITAGVFYIINQDLKKEKVRANARDTGRRRRMRR